MDSSYPPSSAPRPTVPAEVVLEPRGADPYRRSRFWPRVFRVFLFLVLGGSLLLNLILFALVSSTSSDAESRVLEKYYSHQRPAHNKIAIISIEGTILDGEGFVKHQIDHVLHDENVKAVVLRIDSPGGTVSASDYLYHYLGRLTKKEIPIVVSMGGIAASGGYYVSMAVGDRPDVIFAEPTTWTGSIGVVIPHYNLTGLLENWGVKEDSIASHRLKTMGSFTKPMTEEERKILQALVDDSFSRFKDIVKSGRPKFRKDAPALERLATGQIFTADQAKQNGLVDEIGFLDDAVDRAIKLAKLDENDVQVVKYKREASLASLFLGSEARTQGFDLSTVLELSAPRAYYLCTWFSPLASSRQSAAGRR